MPSIKNQCGGTCTLTGFTSILEANYAREHAGKRIDISTWYWTAKDWLERSLSAFDKPDYEPYSYELDGFEARRLLIQYGIVPHRAWKPKLPFYREPYFTMMSNKLKALERQAKLELDALNIRLEGTQGHERTNLLEIKTKVIAFEKRNILKIFDEFVGPLPLTFSYLRKTFTPQQFQEEFFPLLSKPMIHMDYDNSFRRSDLEKPDSDQYFKSNYRMQDIARDLIDSGHAIFLSYDHQVDFTKEDGSISLMKDDSFSLRPYPSRDERVEDPKYHFAFHMSPLVGYAPNPHTHRVKYWTVNGSWGTRYGDKGYFYIYDDYFKEFADSIYFFADSHSAFENVRPAPAD